MSVLTQIPLNTPISFQLVGEANNFFSDSFRNAQITMLMPASASNRFGKDAYSLHQKIYPLLPAGTCPDNADKYNWLLVKTASSEEETLIGEPWINMDTVEGSTLKGYTVYVKSTSIDAAERIRQALVGAGMTIGSITPD